METRKNIYFKVVALTATTIASATPAKAQLSDNGYANIDWQFNVPLSNNFTDKASGWGMNFEGGYLVTLSPGLGFFLNYHSDHEYIPRETLKIGAGDAITNQQHTMFQLPLGAAARYQWNRGGVAQPYVSVKLGAKYVKIRPSLNTLEAREDSWGFYVSPGVDVNVFPWIYGLGLHLALYYSYGINKADVSYYSVDGLNSFGFRIDVSF